MNDQTQNGRNGAWNLQDLLSFGYLYLLLLGITSDSIYYGMVGINILSYSDVLDVLLSPIVRLTENLVFPTIIIIIPGLLYLWLKFIERLHQKKNGGKKDTGPFASLSLINMWLIFSAAVVFSAFIGYGLGGGHGLKKTLAEGKVKTDHRLIFQNGDMLEVKLVGNNSDYVFYAMENAQTITVSPIKENVRSIEKIDR